jgi:hypothetical protein
MPDHVPVNYWASFGGVSTTVDARIVGYRLPDELFLRLAQVQHYLLKGYNSAYL